MIILAATLAKAEYRVFLLEITDTAAIPTAATSPNEGPASSVNTTMTNSPTVSNGSATPPLQKRTVQSTLDPIQYRGFYPLKPTENIRYIDTWMCRGRTDYFKPLCPNPKSPAPAETPSTPQAP